MEDEYLSSDSESFSLSLPNGNVYRRFASITGACDVSFARKMFPNDAATRCRPESNLFVQPQRPGVLNNEDDAGWEYTAKVPSGIRSLSANIVKGKDSCRQAVRLSFLSMWWFAIYV